jgi:hypothetical protein
MDRGNTFDRVLNPRIAVAADEVVLQVMGGIEAYALRDGRRSWRLELPGSPDDQSFAVDDGTVVATTNAYDKCAMRAVDLASGAERRRLERLSPESCGNHAVAVHDGVVAGGDWRRVRDGARIRPGAPPGYPPLFSGTSVFYEPWDDAPGDIEAANVADGRVLWRWDGGGGPWLVREAVTAGPRSVLASRPDPEDPYGRLFLLQLLDKDTGEPIGGPLRSEARALRDSVVVGDGEVLAGGSVVAPGASSVTFPGRRALPPAGSPGSQPPAPPDAFDTFVGTPRPHVPFRLPGGDSTAECRIDGGSWVSCTSPWTTPDLGTDGEHVVEVRDAPSASAARLIIELDRQAPSLEITGGVSGTVGAAAFPFPNFQLSSDDVLAYFECSLDGEPWALCRDDPVVADAGGPHVLRARALDRNGNRSESSERRWTVDFRPPTISIGPVPRPFRTTHVEVPFAVSADAVSVRCSVARYDVDEGGIVEPEAPCSDAWRGTLPERRDGGVATYRLLIEAKDEAGNAQYEEAFIDVDLIEGAEPAPTTPAPPPPAPPPVAPPPLVPTTPWPGNTMPAAPKGDTSPGPARALDNRPTPSPVPCRSTRGSRRGAPRVTAVVRRSGRVIVRAVVPGAGRRRPARVGVQVRSGCGAWRTVVRRTARGRVRLQTPPVPVTTDAVRVRSSFGGRRAVSASRLVP